MVGTWEGGIGFFNRIDHSNRTIWGLEVSKFSQGVGVRDYPFRRGIMTILDLLQNMMQSQTSPVNA